MPYRKEKFNNGEVYHIVTRAIDENLIFKNIDDYYRGIFSIYEFNTTKPVTIQLRRKLRIALKKKLVRGRASNQADEIDLRDKIVEMLAFCFMPNHLHLLVRQLKDNGISKFMSKLGTGYGRYFNEKYGRKGHVFQNNFKAIQIKNDDQLKVVWAYIHTNSVSLIEPKWKEIGIRNPEKVIKFLENYKWSSCSDYLGIANFPSVTERDFILEMMGGQKKCENFLSSYLKYKGRVKEFPEFTIE